jgi:hypothetical protein
VRSRGHWGLVPLPLLLCLVLPAAAATAQSRVDPQILATIRQRFYVAVEQEEATYALAAYVQRTFSGDPESYPPVVLGYYAALEGLKGKHSGNLFAKLRHVQQAIALFDPLVERSPEDLEVRFLRFSFYQQIPAVFGVKGQVPEDLRVLLRLLERRDYRLAPFEVQRDMIRYILKTDEPGPEQRARLERLLQVWYSTGPAADRPVLT